MSIRIIVLAGLCLLPALLFAEAITWDTWMDAAKKAQTTGDREMAEVGYRQAIKCADAFPITDDRVLDTFFALDVFYRATAQTEKVDTVATRVIARFEKAYAEKDPRIGNTLYEKAKLLSPTLNEKAEACFRWALAAREKAAGLHDPSLVEVLTGLADYYSRRGNQREKAEPLLMRAITIQLAHAGGDDVKIIPALQQLATLCANNGRIAEACTFYQRLLDIEEKYLKPDDPQLVWTLSAMAGFYNAWYTTLPEVVVIQQRIAKWYEENGRTDDASYESAVRSLAEAYVQLGYYAEAETLRKGKIADLGTRRVNNLVWALNENTKGLADIARLQGRFKEAEEGYQRRLELQEEAARNADKSQAAYLLSDALLDLAECYQLNGKPKEAVPLFARVKELILGSGYYGANRYMVLTGEDARRGAEEAERQLKSAAAAAERGSDKAVWRNTIAFENLGRFYMVSQRPASAEPPLQRALETWEHMLGPNHRALVPRLTALAACKAAQQQWDEADKLYQRDIAIAEKAYGKDAPLLAPIFDGYLPVLRALKRDADANQLTARAADIRKKLK